MALPSETVTFAGSGLVFNNTYTDTVTEPYHHAILTAENQLQSLFTNAVTLNITFDYQDIDSGAAQNTFALFPVSYSQLVSALTSHATTADDMLAVAGLPTVDPSGAAGFEITSGEGQALGLLGPSGKNDVTVTLDNDEPWFFGQDAVAAILHEITEGGFGRAQSLAVTGSQFLPFDLFRFTTGGVRDFTGGADGQETVFGVDPAHLTGLAFHNAVGPGSTTPDGGDLADWEFTSTDAFGGGGGGYPNTLSAADLQLLDVLGWTPSGAALPALPDDFANSLSDTTHPFGQIVVNTPLQGVIDSYGDRDWFKVQLNAGTDYVINLSGFDGGGGTLDDPVLTLHDAGGVQIDSNDDINFDSFDSQLIVHPATSGTYYLEAGSFADFTGGSYTLSVQAGAAASTAGDDFLVGTLAGGTIMAGAGNDTITADKAQNYLRGEDGNDSIVGGALFDDINGNMGNDTCNGGLGDDWVVGGKGDDSLSGYDGDDIVWGNLGNDTLDGGFGDDQVRGGQGDDSISGGPGADFISGDRGADTEMGGSGADTFHSFSGAGIDKVLDFSYAQGDRVMLDPGTSYTASQVGADTVVDMGNGDQLILVGVTLTTLPADWIFLGP